MRKLLRSILRRTSRVYILPTRMGGYLNGLIFLLFLLSVGYNNNLLLIFTLVLFGLNLIWVMQTHYFLRSLKTGELHIEEGHAGQGQLVRLKWASHPRTAGDWELRLEGSEGEVELRVLETQASEVTAEIILPTRGERRWQYLKVATDLPFGLYAVWIYFKVDVASLTWPALLREVALPHPEEHPEEGDWERGARSPEGSGSLGRYDGEFSRRISWKHYARTGELLVREGEAPMAPVLHFRLRDHRTEAQLSMLATQLVLCQQQRHFFRLDSSRTLGPDTGERHLRECLRELSLC
jgi:uncharacterized protein (DUF58 family)